MIKHSEEFKREAGPARLVRGFMPWCTHNPPLGYGHDPANLGLYFRYCKGINYFPQGAG